jgi:LPXTG-motif cell wall-anchored protein
VTTTLTLTVDPPAAPAGSTVTLTAHIASGTPAPNFSAHVAAPITGTVTFLDGSTTLGTAAVTDGVATLTIAAISEGSHSFSAQFSGDTGFADSTTTAVLDFTATAAGSAAGGSSLPRTGTSADFLVALALLMIVSGGLAVTVKHRHQEAS